MAQSPQDFVLIIDEAHRGAGVTEKARKPIMQKFVIGSDADGLPQVPLVLGMSATPQRFTELLGSTNRTQRPVNIDPKDVQSSGLLKDMIIVHSPKTNAPGDLTLLAEAAARWKQFTELWAAYCGKAKEKEPVRPILVVQVEDGSETITTRTPLQDVIRIIERYSGPLALNEIVHCFQNQPDLQISGRIVRKVEASRIQESGDIKVVLFKTALSTGWDCPRAEIMMSFRPAQDPTGIAQLVGRMIRTPLARRIEKDEVLNTVELFLPHYDSESLKEVLKWLRNPDAEDGLPTRVETSAVEYPRNPTLSAVFDHLKELPSYSVQRAPRMADIKRALRLAGMLVHDGIEKDADEQLRETLISRLKQFRDSLAAKDKEWGAVVREGGEIEVDVTTVAIGQMNVTGTTTVRLALTDENVDQLFDSCGRSLAAGEGLHRTYWKAYHDPAKPNDAKLELFAVLRHQDTIPEMEKLARKEFDALWKKHAPAIKRLSPGDKARFHALIQASGKPVEQEWELPDNIVEKESGKAWQYHLYCDRDGLFRTDLNGWEDAILSDEMKQAGLVGWLRNFPKREWAMCIPYELGGAKPFYPDFVIVRKSGKGFQVDIMEPHDDSRAEPPDVVKGDIARALLYMTVRYTGDAANENKLILTDNTNLIVSGTNFMGRYATLLKWHFADPVSAEERARNDGVYSYQTNRNPFVDHPEWVGSAFIPALTICRSGTNLVLEWTNDYAPSVVVEQSANIAATWMALTNGPGLTASNTFAVSVGEEPGARFYRLRLQ